MYVRNTRTGLVWKPRKVLRVGGVQRRCRVDSNWGAGGVGMNDHRRVSAVKRSIGQVHIGQVEDQQHQEDEAAEYHQPRRVDLPLRHGSILFCQSTVTPVNH